MSASALRAIMHQNKHLSTSILRQLTGTWRMSPSDGRVDLTGRFQPQIGQGHIQSPYCSKVPRHTGRGALHFVTDCTYLQDPLANVGDPPPLHTHTLAGKRGLFRDVRPLTDKSGH